MLMGDDERRRKLSEITHEHRSSYDTIHIFDLFDAAIRSDFDRTMIASRNDAAGQSD